jgi:hypothetical protein
MVCCLVGMIIMHLDLWAVQDLLAGGCGLTASPTRFWHAATHFIVGAALTDMLVLLLLLSLIQGTH